MGHSYADLTDCERRAHSLSPMTDAAARPSTETARPIPDPQEAGRCIFQQSWWLDCVSGGRYAEVTVRNDGRTVGWLPYLITRRWGFATSDMPLLTHTLGPIVNPGTGRANTRLLNRFAIITELLQQLPRLAYFRQTLAPGDSEALAYQAFGCHVRCQFTFVSDCSDIEATWKSMRDKTRNLIRRSGEKNHLSMDSDPEEFLRFYAANCQARRQVNHYQTPTTQQLLQLCVARGQGAAMLSRDQATQKINAGIFVVWDQSCMYFLMSTRDPDTADSGAVSMLVWAAMNEAHRRGLKFDFDGVSSAGTFRFLSGFGGDIATRLVVQKFTWTYHSLDRLRALVYGNAQQPFG
jgi:Acetyltransferase (GNAT) domain